MKKILTIIFAFLIVPISCYAGGISQSIAHAMKTKVSLVAIDPGFGGNNTGPSGCDDNVYAKDINLQIAKKVRDRIKKAKSTQPGP